MKKRQFLIVLMLITNFLVSANNWYVTGSGNDSNDGKSISKAFLTLQRAAGLVQPGDIVYVGNGIYTDEDKSDGSAVLKINISGEANAWITWKAIKGEKPVINPKGWAGIQVTASYNIIEGISVIGNNDSIFLLQAQEDAKQATPNPYFNTNGICFEGRKMPADQKPHHLIIRNCEVGKCAGGGIVGLEIDYLTIEDCKVYNNAWFMRYGGSGITTLNNWAFDDFPGYHIIIQRNYVWNNKTMVPWERIQKLSDGNGILLDVTDKNKQGLTNPNADAVVNPKDNQNLLLATTTLEAPPNPVLQSTNENRPEWKGRALIANNLSAYNGGSGIHVFRTSHVDIVNNTTYWNGTIVGYQELFPNSSHDIVIMNNIIVPRPGGQVTSNNKNTNIHWDYNLYSVEQNVFKGIHDIVADPTFIETHTNVTKGNFKQSKASLGIGSASNDVPQSTDIDGKKRKDTGRDRGAFEQ
ncbi:right-handed parallel beta-helix repeat-containing protein [Flavobacterium psychroterrae]|uniref:Right-handed parallel beta-helix repeat-containing protein n=1 Tax=Flavobacterium psychroterrae TaxID=2133767 RepID=A0ABS5PIG8_9FLAO|nr:right-handed parallel beta-helix repeat-containing protein [Flavobacterium psychroterrae]MBS7234118.1 right-handed parallel beta-helix repeat-containing protein [Flavobacterium psychroterrae]